MPSSELALGFEYWVAFYRVWMKTTTVRKKHRFVQNQSDVRVYCVASIVCNCANRRNCRGVKSALLHLLIHHFYPRFKCFYLLTSSLLHSIPILFELNAISNGDLCLLTPRRGIKFFIEANSFMFCEVAVTQDNATIFLFPFNESHTYFTA